MDGWCSVVAESEWPFKVSISVSQVFVSAIPA